MNIVNLTPHSVVVYKDGGVFVTIPPSGVVARITSSTTVIGEIDGIPVTQTVFEPVTGLPDPQENTIYIVSLFVHGSPSVAHRTDLYRPDTGPQSAVRDADNKIIGVTALAH